MKTHYDALNLEKNCSYNEIRNAFLKLSKQYHPDVNKSLEAKRKFVQINEAYSVLKKPITRELYDKSLSVTGKSYYNSGSMRMNTHHPYMYDKYWRKNDNIKYGSYTSDIKTRKIVLFFACYFMVISGYITSVRSIKNRTKHRIDLMNRMPYLFLKTNRPVDGKKVPGVTEP